MTLFFHAAFRRSISFLYDLIVHIDSDLSLQIFLNLKNSATLTKMPYFPRQGAAGPAGPPGAPGVAVRFIHDF